MTTTSHNEEFYKILQEASRLTGYNQVIQEVEVSSDQNSVQDSMVLKDSAGNEYQYDAGTGSLQAVSSEEAKGLIPNLDDISNLNSELPSAIENGEAFQAAETAVDNILPAGSEGLENPADLNSEVPGSEDPISTPDMILPGDGVQEIAENSILKLFRY